MRTGCHLQVITSAKLSAGCFIAKEASSFWVVCHVADPMDSMVLCPLLHLFLLLSGSLVLMQ
jgi:hypothetical protein